MTPKEKAKELIDKMNLKQMPSLNLARNEINLNDTFFNAKQCALIAIDYILNSEPSKAYFILGDWITPKTFWQEVKQEIINL